MQAGVLRRNPSVPGLFVLDQGRDGVATADDRAGHPYLMASMARLATSQAQVARVTILETTRDKVGVEIQREDEGKEAGADRDEKDTGQAEEDDADGAEAMGTG